MKKRVMSLLLALACVLGLSACEKTPEEPPELRVVAADGTVLASRGSYSWEWKHGLTATGVDSDSVHPLQFKSLELLTTDAGTVRLEFAVEPDSVTAGECWDDAHLGGDPAVPAESWVLAGNEVELKRGGHVYVVVARWEREKYGGVCTYVFHVNCTE